MAARAVMHLIKRSQPPPGERPASLLQQLMRWRNLVSVMYLIKRSQPRGERPASLLQ